MRKWYAPVTYESSSKKTKLILDLKRQQGQCADCNDVNDVDFFYYISDDLCRNNKSIYKMTMENIGRALDVGSFVCKLCWYKRWDIFRNEYFTYDHKNAFVSDKFNYTKFKKLDLHKCNKCMRIVTDENYRIFDFDHIERSSKRDSVYKLTASPDVPLSDVMDEIDKCQLLCYVCHRKKTLSEVLPPTDLVI